MIKLNCPACGAEVEFRSKASVFSVCSFCRSTLVRQDMNLEKLGEMAELQDDLTPLQIGTKGQCDNEPFELVGRLRVAYEGGAWNEWYALSGDKECWLSEAQGFYAFCRPVENSAGITRDSIFAGKSVYVDKLGMMDIDDARDVFCLYSEGELPFKAQLGRRSFSVDLSGPHLKMATIEITDSEVRIFKGRYLEFDEFNFQNLRRIDGW